MIQATNVTLKSLFNAGNNHSKKNYVNTGKS